MGKLLGAVVVLATGFTTVCALGVVLVLDTWLVVKAPAYGLPWMALNIWFIRWCASSFRKSKPVKLPTALD